MDWKLKINMLKEKQIGKGNALIAKFMGGKENYKIGNLFWDLPQENGLMLTYKLFYHKDWGWLMKVVNKIYSMDSPMAIQTVMLVQASIPDRISNAWLGVINFIEWYNKNNE